MMTALEQLNQINKNRSLGNLEIFAHEDQGKFHLNGNGLCTERKEYGELHVKVKLKDFALKACVSCCDNITVQDAPIINFHRKVTVGSLLRLDNYFTAVEKEYQVDDDANFAYKKEVLFRVLVHEGLTSSSNLGLNGKALYDTLHWRESSGRVEAEKKIIESIMTFNQREYLEAKLSRTSAFRSFDFEGFEHMNEASKALQLAKERMLDDSRLYPVAVRTDVLDELVKKNPDYLLISKLYIKNKRETPYVIFAVPAALAFCFRHEVNEQSFVSLGGRMFSSNEPLTPEQFEIFSGLLKDRNPQINQLEKVFEETLEAAKAL